MIQSKLPKKFWSYVVLHAVFLMNRIPTKLLKNKSSYEVLYGKLPELSSLKVFGCLCYGSTLSTNRHKFDPRARKCAFLGFKQGMKGYILLDTSNFEIVISRNVKFFDMEFPFIAKSSSNDSTCIYSDQSSNLSDFSMPKAVLDVSPSG